MLYQFNPPRAYYFTAWFGRKEVRPTLVVEFTIVASCLQIILRFFTTFHLDSRGDKEVTC